MSRGALYAFGLLHRDGWANPSLMSELLPLGRMQYGNCEQTFTSGWRWPRSRSTAPDIHANYTRRLS